MLVYATPGMSSELQVASDEYLILDTQEPTLMTQHHLRRHIDVRLACSDSEYWSPRVIQRSSRSFTRWHPRE